jgi:hypothetical protein
MVPYVCGCTPTASNDLFNNLLKHWLRDLIHDVTEHLLAIIAESRVVCRTCAYSNHYHCGEIILLILVLLTAPSYETGEHRNLIRARCFNDAKLVQNVWSNGIFALGLEDVSELQLLRIFDVYRHGWRNSGDWHALSSRKRGTAASLIVTHRFLGHINHILGEPVWAWNAQIKQQAFAHTGNYRAIKHCLVSVISLVRRYFNWRWQRIVH